MNPKVVFIRKICPGQKDLDLLPRPISLISNNGKRKCLAAENRAVVHASSIGILVTTGADRRPIPTRRLTAGGIHAAARRSGACVWCRGWANGRPSLFNGDSDDTSCLRGIRAVDGQNAEQGDAG